MKTALSEVSVVQGGGTSDVSVSISGCGIVGTVGLMVLMNTSQAPSDVFGVDRNRDE